MSEQRISDDEVIGVAAGYAQVEQPGDIGKLWLDLRDCRAALELCETNCDSACADRDAANARADEAERAVLALVDRRPIRDLDEIMARIRERLKSMQRSMKSGAKALEPLEAIEQRPEAE